MSTMTVTMTHRPIGKRFLLRKSSNAENLPPASKKADALVSAREASRRRRARVVSGSLPLKVKKAMHNTQRRASKTKTVYRFVPPKTIPENVQPASPSEPLEDDDPEIQEIPPPPGAFPTYTPKDVSSGMVVKYPRYLRRPPPERWPMPIPRENVDVCDPGLVGVDMMFIRRGLEAAGEPMWNLVKNAHIDHNAMGHCATLPNEIKVIVADHAKALLPSLLPPSPPTHVLAVWNLPTSHPVRINDSIGVNPETGRRKVSLVAVHNLVLATHCAKWFALPPPPSLGETRVTNAAGVAGTQLSLPVVPLAVPHPPSFLFLIQTLYTHKVSWLLDQLVPVPKPEVQFPTAANPQPRNAHYIVETGRRLAWRYTPYAITDMLSMVMGLWQNAVYLGVSDERLWIGIDWSWDMLLTGLAFAVGRPDLMPRPQPQVRFPASRPVPSGKA